jgi:four helix bundle protein
VRVDADENHGNDSGRRSCEVTNEKVFALESRLVDFSVRVIKVSDSLPDTRTGNHLRNQLLRSGTAPAANYAEAQSAESRRDFVHKLKLALKELRETKVWLQLILRAELIQGSKLDSLIDESNQLISIFVASVKTAATVRSRSANEETF